MGVRVGLLEATLEIGGPHVAPPQGTLDVLLEETPVALQHLRRLLVQGVLGVRLLGGGWGVYFFLEGGVLLSFKGVLSPPPVLEILGHFQRGRLGVTTLGWGFGGCLGGEGQPLPQTSWDSLVPPPTP